MLVKSYHREAYERLCHKALLRMGNRVRITGKFMDLLRGKELTIAYVGGSITQGVGANEPWKECYAFQSFLKIREMLKSKLGLTEGQVERIRFLKAGLAGTGSELCSVRYEKDIGRDGKENPDIVIVEFCVNDEEDETGGVFYESLIRRILKQKSQPAVVLLFSVFQNGFNLQRRMLPVGEWYDLPVISIKNGIYSQFGSESEIISCEEFFSDPLHPSNLGHTFMADCICCYFERLLEVFIKENKTNTETKKDKWKNNISELSSIYGNDMENMCLLDRVHSYEDAQIEEGDFAGIDGDLQCAPMDDKPEEIPAFSHNWHFAGCCDDVAGKPFRMKINAQTLAVVLKDSEKKEFGKACVYVDGKLCRIFDPQIVNWTHCHVMLLYDNVPGWHEVEILQQPAEQGKKVTILGFGYVK